MDARKSGGGAGSLKASAARKLLPSTKCGVPGHAAPQHPMSGESLHREGKPSKIPKSPQYARLRSGGSCFASFSPAALLRVSQNYCYCHCNGFRFGFCPFVNAHPRNPHTVVPAFRDSPHLFPIADLQLVDLLQMGDSGLCTPSFWTRRKLYGKKRNEEMGEKEICGVAPSNSKP
jgi:hypothetical protein